MTEKILKYTALELGNKIKVGEVTTQEVCAAVFEQIKKREKELNCYITIEEEGALARAKEVQRQMEEGKLTSPLAGVPVAIKDNISTRGMRTTCGSRMLDRYIPIYDAHVVERLKEAGAVIIGKTNMDEFAMGSTTESSHFGPTKNPYHPKHVPGGSSGGSAAAVAAKECFFALGSDTGGSVRQPAAHCGLVGMKPTYGTVSRYGLVAFASSLDQIGPLCKDVSDCAAVLDVITGHDKKDSTSVKRNDGSFLLALTKDIKGMRIGLPTACFGKALNIEVKNAIYKAVDLLRQKGAIVEEFALPLTEYAVATYYTIACAEASSNLERFDGVKYGYRTKEYEELHQMYKRTRTEGFGGEVKRRIMLGSFVLSSGYYDAYYLKALKVKAKIKEAFEKAFERYDVLLTPVTHTTAQKLGESPTDPLDMYLLDAYTVSANLAGLPAMSIPCGMAENGLPIGMQLVGNAFEEKKMLRVAYAYECVQKECVGKESNYKEAQQIERVHLEKEGGEHGE